ncbi:MAG: hypothetical protein ABI836_00275 [Gemmatimonadota bacterium]
MTRGLVIMGVLLSACGGASGGASGQAPAAPAPAAEAALQLFLHAVADSNVTAMADHWGTSRGSASRTNNPSDYQKRIVIMQAFLRGTQYRILSNEPVPGENNQRLIAVELTRTGCTNQVPFTMIRTGRGEWLVYQFNLELVGSPNRPCAPPDSTQH